MKRTACFCLALALLLTGLSPACAEKGRDGLFLFWDIPFETKHIEFLRLTMAKNGFVFIPGEVKDLDSWEDYGFQKKDWVLTTDPEHQRVSLLGYELEEIYAAFVGPYSHLRGFFFRFVGNPEQGPEEKVAQIAVIYDALCAKYGEPPSDGVLTVVADGRQAYYDLPVQNGALDQGALLQALQPFQTVGLTLDWRNIRFYALGPRSMVLAVTDELPAPLEREESLGYYGGAKPEPTPVTLYKKRGAADGQAA